MLHDNAVPRNVGRLTKLNCNEREHGALCYDIGREADAANIPQVSCFYLTLSRQWERRVNRDIESR